ncbi:GNAT family N-acetyltransferase [Shinella sp.]|uniref:GNAT family N-acetyltransferase n=1 Tax=Shinella sp. TaxID=1870904 RepID=UPI004036B550
MAHLRHFAVDSAHARRSIGRLIVARCADMALRRGASRFQAFSSLNAEPFYESVCLKRQGVIQIPMAEDIGFPAVLMEVRIAVAP